MKAKVIWLIVILAIIGIWVNREPQPLVVDGVTDDGRRYFCVYELNQGEDDEQVKDQVVSNR